jgi:hypothetical protein
MKLSLLGTGFLTVALLTGSAFADHDRDHDRDHDGWRKHEQARHVAEHDRRPPGWDHGQKRGWGDHHVPPGQAKKQAWEHHEARERREHELHAREAREARERRAREWHARHEAREHKMQDWRERERRERERRAEWRRHHPNGITPARGTTPTPTTPAGPVATTRPPSGPGIITPSGRRIPTGPQN